MQMGSEECQINQTQAKVCRCMQNMERKKERKNFCKYDRKSIGRKIDRKPIGSRINLNALQIK